MEETDLTHDAFLGGRLHLWQPRRGYRAGVDPVLLAASVPAHSGQTVLDLGCGVGAAALCLAARVDGVELIGVELQDAYAELAQRNAEASGHSFQVVQADLRSLPIELRKIQFDHVMMNPPYFDRSRGTSSDNAGRDAAFGGETTLADWIDVGTRRLAPKGHLTLIQRIERLPEVLAAITPRLGSVVVRPIAGREERAPERFLLRAIHSGRTAFQLTSPLVMHHGSAHERDAESYTEKVRAVLRDGAALDILG